MTDQEHIEAKIKRDFGMDPESAARLTREMLNADDLYWICPLCKNKITGKMTVLRKGCPTCELL